MSSSYPVLVLVHGAWHHPSHYKLLVEAFSNEGFQDIVTPRNPTSGSIEQVVDKSYLDDVQVIQEAIAPFLDAGRDLVLVAHSYGGVPAASSLKGNTVQERAEKGLRGGIRGLVSIAAFLLPQKGLPLFQPDGTQYGPTFDVQDGYVGTTSMFREALFRGVKSDQVLPELNKQSRLSLETPVQVVAGDFDIPKVYFVCEDDEVVPAEQQLAMAQAAAANVVTLPSGHSPHLDKQHSQAIAVKVSELFAHGA
ncbi:Alpha/beta hydrolase fold-1 [Fusarium tricinctum]|uniref:Alpha/beta hydrolase fold-1 n=1 Tax=Fusarium tricinctum TaxID=61284 RepID=A0A8K0SDR0_9HYPO|nr:Alpha/beta hydrolase fold-1 [Fusarium tricinctum]